MTGWEILVQLGVVCGKRSVNVMLEMKARVEAPEGTDKSGSIREMYPPTRVWKEVTFTRTSPQTGR